MSRFRNRTRHRHYREAITSAPDARDEEIDPAPLRQWCKVMRATALGWEHVTTCENLTSAITVANAQRDRCVVFSMNGKRLYDNGR